MRSVTYSMSMSLDGYIVGPDGSFQWSEPDDELFVFATDEVRALGAHLLGRNLYEAMAVWEAIAEDPDTDDLRMTFAVIWNDLPKVVFSSTLSSADGPNTRLAEGDLAAEIARLRAEPGDGNIAIGGATLAAEAAALDLIDEYRVRIYPVLVGGGTPYFAHGERFVNLDLLETRTFPVSNVTFNHYRVVR